MTKSSFGWLKPQHGLVEQVKTEVEDLKSTGGRPQFKLHIPMCDLPRYDTGCRVTCKPYRVFNQKVFTLLYAGIPEQVTGLIDATGQVKSQVWPETTWISFDRARLKVKRIKAMFAVKQLLSERARPKRQNP